MIPDYLIWLVLVIGFGVIEAATMGLTSIWFACGALAAMVCALLGVSMWVQIPVFALVSLAALWFIGKRVKGQFNHTRQATNADRILGELGIVTEAIDNRQARGAVKVCGSTWSARSVNDEDIPAGAEVVIRSIEGVKVMVEMR